MTIKIPEMNVSYHSVYGAIRESKHVFIDTGLNFLLSQSTDNHIRILEVGFGTGLNALLTLIEVENTATGVYYVALDPLPISTEEASLLNYCEQLKRKDLQEDFIRMHECGWNKGFSINENILMHKSDKTLQTFQHATNFNLVYFDAFAPAAQPELWTKDIFQKLFDLLEPNGILVTYCSKGDVRRNMMAAGFHVTKLPGPPGKREISRATKPNSGSS